MDDASTSKNMSPGLLKVAERARREPDAQFHSVAHLIDVEALARAYHRQRCNAAVGVDGVTKDEYGRDLETNLRDLHGRMKTMRYRHQPIRRVHIPKGKGRTRPLGISAFEDKIVQDALREVLQAIYEQTFLDCSYGFRPGRSAHDAIRAFRRVADRGEVNWILECDVKTFFDSVDRNTLLALLKIRVPDGSIKRLVGKCLHVGVLDGAEFTRPDTGTAQGSVLSPLLANVYLHYALDLWFEREVKPRLDGKSLLIRYADDFIICFESKEDAERVMGVLGKRLARFALTLEPTKTRLVPFRRPPWTQQRGTGPDTFDFLGFTLYWRRTRRGSWRVGCKTRSARLRRSITAVHDWCRRHRHEPVGVQHAALTRRLHGHMQYFAVNGNERSVGCLLKRATRAWFKWLCRRSQKKRLNWPRFLDLLRDYPLPEFHVCVQIWDT
jgi:group II intron reverse transcriptase/maturase